MKKRSDWVGHKAIMALLLWCLSAALLLPSAACLAAEADPEKLHQQAQEMIVTIKDSEGVSGGVIVSTKGLILCDDRAMATLGPKTFVVRSFDARGEMKETQYTDYKLVGVHREHHLALVQLVGVKQRLEAARWRKPRGKEDLEAYLFGIFIKEFDGELKGPIKAELTDIEEQRKDTVSRVQSDVDIYGEMPCALALSPRGQVLGVVYNTRKQVDRPFYHTTGVLLELDRRLFVDPSRREPRKDGHAEVKEFDGEYRISWMRGRALLADDWQSAKACAELGRSLVHYKRYETGRLYLDYALEQDPTEPTALHGLEQLLKDHKQLIYDEGTLEEQLIRLQEQTFMAWAKNSGAGHSVSISSLSKTLADQGQHAKAVYYQAWHVAVDPKARPSGVNPRYLAAISDEQREHLAKLKHARQFSFRDLTDYLNKMEQVATAEGRPDFDKLHAQAKPFPAEGVLLDIKEGRRVNQIELGHFGRYAALLTSKRLGSKDSEYTITLYDLIDGSKVRDLRTVTDEGAKRPRLALGANMLVVYLMTPKVFEVIDIHTGKKLTVKPSPFAQHKFIKISPERDDILIVSGEGKVFLPEFRFETFVADGESVEYVKYTKPSVLHDPKYGNHLSFNFPPPGPKQPRPKGQRDYLIHGSADAFLQSQEPDQLDVLRIKDHSVIKSNLLPQGAEIKTTWISAASGNADRVILWNPNSTDIPLLVSLGLRDHAKQASQFGNTPGATWRLKLAVDPKAEVEIQDGPKAMRYDAATQSLLWDIPSDAKPGKVSLILLVREPGKEERYILPEFTVEKAK